MEQSHVMNLLVLGADSTVPVTAAAAYIDAYTDLDDGAFSVCNDENMVLSATTVLTDDRVALTGIKLVGRYGTKLVWSDMIKSEDIITYRAIADAAGAEQVTHVGYTATTGAIQILNDNLYKLKVMFWEEGRTGQGVNDSVSVYYESDATATGTEVVYSLEELLRLSFNKQAERPLYMRVLNSAAIDANMNIDHNVTAVNGSKFIVSAADWSTDGGVEVAAVGDSIRIGGAAETNAAVALGSTVYKIVAIPAADTIELDRPFTGASAAYTASANQELIKAATANAANFGIEFHGIARTHVVGKKPYSKVRFTIGLENFGTTTTTYTTAMSLGHGNADQIEDLEWFTAGQNGYKYRGDYMYHPAYTSRVTAGNTYNQIALTWGAKSRSESIGGPGLNPKQLIIAIDVTYDDNDANDIVIDVLDAWSTIASGLGV
jgi:hypothetical protein